MLCVNLSIYVVIFSCRAEAIVKYELVLPLRIFSENKHLGDAFVENQVFRLVLFLVFPILIIIFLDFGMFTLS